MTSGSELKLTRSNLQKAYRNRWLRSPLGIFVFLAPVVVALLLAFNDPTGVLRRLTASTSSYRGGTTTDGSFLVGFWVVALVWWAKLRRSRSVEDVIVRADRLAELRESRKAKRVLQVIEFVKRDNGLDADSEHEFQIVEPPTGIPTRIRVAVGMNVWELVHDGGTWRYVSSSTRFPFPSRFVALAFLILRLVVFSVLLLGLLFGGFAIARQPEVLSYSFWRNVSSSEQALLIFAVISWTSLTWVWLMLRRRSNIDAALEAISETTRKLEEDALKRVAGDYGIASDQQPFAVLIRRNPIRVRIRAAGRSWVVEKTPTKWEYIRRPAS